nr:grpE protein homolog 2, mitochondrial-like isoform X1 [Ipomoea batatas]
MSSASTQSDEKETAQARNGQGNTVESDAAASANGNGEVPDETNKSGSDMGPNTNTSENIKRRRRSTKQTLFSDSDSDLDVEDLSRDDLVKLIVEKEEKLNAKQKELDEMKDKVLRTYAEMENTMDRNRRESENTKKFAVQNFAKSLLDVADNLGRASSVVKESFSKIDTANDNTGAVPLLKTLLEGVEMTEKQLAEVFKKFGVTKYDPINEEFDPNKHNAVFQVPDPSKPPGTVAIVLKVPVLL